MREILDRFSSETKSLEEGCYANFLGLVTDSSLFGNSDALVNQVRMDPPIPDDGVYGSMGEYLSVLEAVESAQLAGRSSFAMVELGAGWGPWVSAAGVVCKRLGFSKVELVGIEADEDRFNSLKQHFARNGLLESPVFPKFIKGAAWDVDTIIHFPKTGIGDHGGAGSASGDEYRGLEREMVAVEAFCFESIAAHLDVIDLTHWDIQGAEARVAESSGEFLDKRVRSVQVGTHSREQEARVLKVFHSLGWDLIRQSPCTFRYDVNIPTLEGMTTNDGELYFRNPRLW